MRKLLLTLGLVGLTACQGGANPIDPKQFLTTLDGPKVPTVQDSLLETAKNEEKQGNFKSATQYYQQALEKAPEDKVILLALADNTRRTGDSNQAIALYDALLQKDAGMTSAKEGKALALIAKGDFETPGPLLEDIMKTESTRWKTLNALGILFTTRNLHNEAQQYFNAALAQSPSNTSVLNNLGLSQALNKNFDAAIATLSQAAAMSFMNSMDRKRIDLNLSLVYAVAGKLDQARSVAEHYYSGAVLNNSMGLYAHLAQDDELAKTYLNMALTDSKTFYERAWDNLQTISGNSSGDAGKPSAEAAPEKTEATPAGYSKNKPTTEKKPTAKVKTGTVKNLADQAPKSPTKTDTTLSPDEINGILKDTDKTK